jgi:ferritin-like metal-binding protein YciE
MQQRLKRFFEDGLKDIYWAESINKALPKMGKKCNGLINSCVESHLKETEEHVTRLEKIFESLSKAVAKKCDAMADYLKRLKELSKKLKLRCS